MSSESDAPVGQPEAERDVKRARSDNGHESPQISVLMPCRNAMPWLPSCVASILAQEEVVLELIVVDDTSTDGSREFLLELERVQSDALLKDKREAATESETLWPLGCCKEDIVIPSATEVLAKRVGQNHLKVLTVDQKLGPSGQGAALNKALKNATGTYIGEMESDDLRPPHAFANLKKALVENPDWEGVTSQVRLIGWEREGMDRYISWQNAQLTPDQMKQGRFIEIPALRGTGLYRREALQKLKGYRDLWELDGCIADCANLDDPYFEKDPASRPPGYWPVDSDFWMRWFELGMTVAKLPEELYFWRQYPQQSTRTHERCSLDRLRSCKAFFLTRSGAKHFQIWSVGTTLEAWKRDLEGFGAESVQCVTYKPGSPPQKEALAQGKEPRWMRLFAFGTEKARDKVMKHFPGLDLHSGRDMFVA